MSGRTEDESWETLVEAKLMHAIDRVDLNDQRVRIEEVIELGTRAAVAVTWEDNFGEYGVRTHLSDFGRNRQGLDGVLYHFEHR